MHVSCMTGKFPFARIQEKSCCTFHMALTFIWKRIQMHGTINEPFPTTTSSEMACLMVNQNYNKFLERDWLSAVRFEH